jgi:hypothetical protein
MENKKIIYGSTNDFLRYISDRTRDKEKVGANKPVPNTNLKKRNNLNKFN